MSVFCPLSSDFCFAQEWQELRGDHFIIYYENDSDGFVKEVLRQAERDYSQIASDLGYARYANFWQWENRVKIFIYPDQDSFLKATLQPSWSVGTANYTTKQISGFSGCTQFKTDTLAHEIAHLVFRDFVGFVGEVPLWLDEGVAQSQEKSKRELINYYARALYEKNQLLSLKSLTEMDVRRVAEGAQAQDFYVQAASLVSFLIERYGADNFTHFCRQLRDGKSLDEALRFAYAGRIGSSSELERKWLKYVSEIKITVSIKTPGGTSIASYK
ncbi:MAG: peptidase MA family metallohydrolase [Candidatus Omnitrophota bacterium]